ncbi:hypothetical protein LCGC14_1925410 [marine sediment metagenome]|uniref:Uncharacterized protein n=1 Tax=marine sediment metagenome TaxID=412755 RepID=A0A0F9IME6_9ZZZZ
MGLYNLGVLPKMDIKKAKGIVGSYLEHSIIQDVKNLGEEHYYEACECSIGEIKEAFDLLGSHYNYFKGD